MTWKTQEYKRERDSTRFWNIVQFLIYLAALGVGCWGILWGLGKVADAAPPGELCGNGQVDPGENCTTCPEDVMCLECETCVGPKCVDLGGCGDCGNGEIDPGENCLTCPEDAPCLGCLTCNQNAICVSDPLCNCGNGLPDPGETCATCPDDVVCPKGLKCIDGKCLNNCNSMVSPMEVLFLFDRSGSLTDEVAALCGTLDGIQESLEAFGLDVTITVLGIGTGIPIPCSSGAVVGIHNESWGPAVEIMSGQFPWQTNARIIVPISDEAPHEGDPCDYGNDAESIQLAIAAANKNNVIVSPIMGEPWGMSPECVIGHAQVLAHYTGGTVNFSAKVDMEQLVLDLIQSTLCGCAGDLNADGEVGIDDFLLLLMYWGSPESDIDGDGDTDMIDLILLLQRWGPC